MIADWLVGLAMLHGHPPDAARNYAQRDLELLGIVHDMMHTLPEDHG